MSLYRAGLAAGAAWFPMALEPERTRVAAFVSGARAVALQPRLYARGISGQGPYGVVGWVRDLVSLPALAVGILNIKKALTLR